MTGGQSDIERGRRPATRDDSFNQEITFSALLLSDRVRVPALLIILGRALIVRLSENFYR
jgi:hypothetical protein